MKIENSSLIKEIDFNDASQTITVKFNNGKKYRYLGATQKLYDDFTNSDSKGKFFHAKIKGLKCEEVIDEK